MYDNKIIIMAILPTLCLTVSLSVIRTSLPISTKFVPIKPRTPIKTQAKNTSTSKLTEKKRCALKINLFTALIDHTDDPRKVAAQHNVIMSYARLRSQCLTPWVFTRSQYWTDIAHNRGIKTATNYSCTRGGTPLLKSLYNHIERQDPTTPNTATIDTYANGDIVFTQQFPRTLEALHHIWKFELIKPNGRRLFVTGKRSNVPCSPHTNLTSDLDTQNLARASNLFYNNAQDYFALSRGAMHWASIPDFVIGRRAYDNWLVHHAHNTHNIDLVDATLTVLALHLTANDGNTAGHHKHTDNNWNVEAVNPRTKAVIHGDEFSEVLWYNIAIHHTKHAQGTTDHAHFYTSLLFGNIVVQSRNPMAHGRRLPSHQ